jgi:hypothetical protein
VPSPGLRFRPLNRLLPAIEPWPEMESTLVSRNLRRSVLLGAIDVASERVETPEEIAATIEQASLLSQWSGSTLAPIAAWRRWIARQRSANLSHSALVPHSPVGDSNHSAGEEGGITGELKVVGAGCSCF